MNNSAKKDKNTWEYTQQRKCKHFTLHPMQHCRVKNYFCHLTPTNFRAEFHQVSFITCPEIIPLASRRAKLISQIWVLCQTLDLMSLGSLF